MKITVVCDVLGEANNGTSLAAYNLIKYLKKCGHDVTVISPDGPSGEGFIRVKTLNLGPFLNRVLDRNGVKLAKPSSAILEPYIKDADLVHLLLPFPLSWRALCLARRYSKPVTASFHCQAENFTAHIGMMNMHFVNDLTYKTFYRFIYRRCDAVHYPTEFIRRVFESATAPTNAYVISNGVNDMFTMPHGGKTAENEKFTIVCCGRYSKEKAQFQLISAAAKSKYKDRLHIIFAGDGPDRRKLESLAAKLGVECEFGFFKREDLVRVFQGADLYVHTAVVEIEAIACLEAICCGLVPVICNSERSATRYFAVGDNSLFEEYNADDLAEKIDYWYSHPAEKEKRRAAYAPLRASLSQDMCMARMEDMMRETSESYEEEHCLQRSAE